MSLKRRKFLGFLGLAGAGIMTFFGGLAAFFQNRNSGTKRTSQFLTHDGKLVEVDLSKIKKNRGKASKDDVIKWVWKEQKI